MCSVALDVLELDLYLRLPLSTETHLPLSLKCWGKGVCHHLPAIVVLKIYFKLCVGGWHVHVSAGVCGGQREASHPLKLELQMFVRC